MYKIEKLTMAERVSIPVGAVVEITVNERLSVPENCYGMFFLRKSFARIGVIQVVNSPFPSNWIGKPCVVLKNDSVFDVEILKDEEIGEVYCFDGL